MTLSFNISLVTTGYPLERAMIDRMRKLDTNEQFSHDVIEAFSGVIETTAPSDTGFMVKTLIQRERIGLDNEGGYGVGSYSLIGDPSKKASKGTVKRFIKAYPKLRGRRPIAPKGAWWMLSKAGKDQLRESRKQGLYGGSKPAYWYAIARGLVPDAEGNKMPANIFVDFAIDYANSERKALAKLYFGG